MGKKTKIDVDREEVYGALPAILKDNAYVEKIDGITSIPLFNEAYPPKNGLSKYRLKMSCDMVIMKNEKPFLAIELETSTDPQVIFGLIVIHMMSKWIKIRKNNMDLNQYPIELPLLLLIVLPELTDTLRDKWMNLEVRLKDMLKFNENKLSTLKDFEVCEIEDFKPALNRLLERNNYNEYQVK
jgi:hypothetical protein